MKKLVNILLTLLVFAGLGWTLWVGMRKQKEKPSIEESAPATESAATDKDAAPAEFTVTLEKEKADALELAKAEVQAAELTPQRIAFGRVLDPTPIITLDSDLSAADAALAASRSEFERAQSLFKAGENVAKKVFETAEAQFRSDEIKATALRRTALLNWGAEFAALDPAGRRAFIDRFLKDEAALVRVDILPGDAISEPPRSARVLVLGREQQPIETKTITPATDVDPKTQAQGFVLLIDQPPFPLVPGMALTAWLELPEKPRAGLAIPRSAILRHDGRAWIYVQEDEEKYVRKPIKLETPLEGGKGWFVATKTGGIKAGDMVVTTGAQAILSAELKAQGGTAGEE